MSKKEIQKDYKKRIKLINQYNDYYYDKSAPKVTDKEYDELKESILFLEKKYDFLNSKNSPDKTVGYKPSKNFQKITHKVPMLSLANAFARDDLINFEKKIQNLEKKRFEGREGHGAQGACGATRH